MQLNIDSTLQIKQKFKKLLRSKQSKLILRKPGPVSCGICILSKYGDLSFPNRYCFPDFDFLTSLVTPYLPLQVLLSSLIYPGWQLHRYAPGVSSHCSNSPQTEGVRMHSLTSVLQSIPAHPVLQRQLPSDLSQTSVFAKLQMHVFVQLMPYLVQGHSKRRKSYFRSLLKIIQNKQYHNVVANLVEKKKENWLSPMTKAPTLTEKYKKQRDNTKNATKNFDYTTIADRLRTVSWSNSSQPTGVVKPVYERSTFPLVEYETAYLVFKLKRKRDKLRAAFLLRTLRILTILSNYKSTKRSQNIRLKLDH